MRKIGLVVILTTLLLLLACQCQLEQKEQTFHTGPGYIRSLYVYPVDTLNPDRRPPAFVTTVVFERDDGTLMSYNIKSNGELPIWVGLHCDIEYSASGKFISAKRLGSDAGKEEGEK